MKVIRALLITASPATVACVIKADRESLRVLDQDGSISTRFPSQVTKVEERRNVVATDKNGSEIRVGDTVRELSGENKTGKILHIHRSYVFMHNKLQLENSGLWTTRTTNVVTTAVKGGGRVAGSGPDMSKMNPALLRHGGPNGSMMPPPRSMGRDPLLGRQVKIRRGPHKGNVGLVRDTTDATARIELLAKASVVTVEKDLLTIIEYVSVSSISFIDLLTFIFSVNTGKTLDYSQFRGSRGAPGGLRTGFGAAAPRIPDSGYSGSRTPMGAGYGDGGRTPAWGGASRTPAWTGPGSSALDSGRTPTWKGPGAGSQTSYGGAGNTTTYGGPANYGTSDSRTPAWTSSARTPYGADHGGYTSSNTTSSGFDAFAAGSRTPAYGAGSTAYSGGYNSSMTSSRTPAWGGQNSSSSTVAASAPTPGRTDDAPTPAVLNNYSAPTPGASGRHIEDDDPYTPAPYSAPTPGAGAYDAPTPGASGPGMIPKFAHGGNLVPLGRSRFDAPTPAANAPTPFASGGGYDAPTPAAGTGGGPRYAEDSDED